MAKPDFTQIWATTGSKTAVSNANWQQGWEYIGTGYPPRGVFNQWQYTADSRAKYLHDQINSVVTAASLTLDDIDTRLLEAIRLIAFPVGSYIEHSGDTAPDGFLIANGDLVSRTTYSRLFAAIGTKYGSGDGSTTFKLPDARGRHLRGADLGSGLVSGFNVGSVLADAVGPHTHGGVPLLSSDVDRGGNSSSFSIDDTGQTATNTNVGETRVKALGTLICIKY